MEHLRSLAAAALVSAALAGCAAASHGGVAAGASPREQGCGPAAFPEALPAADALVDSAALARDLAALWRAAGSPSGGAVVALRYDRHGVNVRRDVVRHALPSAVADSLQKLVFAHRRTVARARHEWGVRLAVRPGEEPALAVARGEVCEARPRSRLAAAAADDPWSVRNSTALPGAEEGGTVWVRVRLDAHGFVTDARVERGVGPRVLAAETQLLAYARSIAFLPATEDGYPVSGETSIALRVGR